MNPPRAWPAEAPSLGAAGVTLLADGPGGLVWATTVADKRRLLEGTTGPLWAFWKGRYASHLFTVDRAQAELEVGDGGKARVVDPRVERLLAWFEAEGHRQGLVTIRSSRASTEVAAAKRVLGAETGATIRAVVQFAFTDEWWRAKVLTVAALWARWDKVHRDWERAGAAPYDKDWVRESV